MIRINNQSLIFDYLLSRLALVYGCVHCALCADRGRWRRTGSGARSTCGLVNGPVGDFNGHLFRPFEARDAIPTSFLFSELNVAAFASQTRVSDEQNQNEFN